jgi:hypothetical protein
VVATASAVERHTRSQGAEDELEVQQSTPDERCQSGRAYIQVSPARVVFRSRIDVAGRWCRSLAYHRRSSGSHCGSGLQARRRDRLGRIASSITSRVYVSRLTSMYVRRRRCTRSVLVAGLVVVADSAELAPSAVARCPSMRVNQRTFTDQPSQPKRNEHKHA